MKRPIELDYISLTAYTRALEAYCDTLAKPEPAIIGTYLEKDKEQEPVAMRYDFDGYGYKYIDTGSGSDWKTRIKEADPLYTSPPQRKPLTTDQMYAAIRPLFKTDALAEAALSISFAEYRAIEKAAHGIKGEA